MLAKLLDGVPIPVKEALDDPIDKIDVLPRHVLCVDARCPCVF